MGDLRVFGRPPLGARALMWTMLVAGCGDEAARPPLDADVTAPEAGPGEACGPVLACEAGLVCFDGLCASWGWPGDVAPAPGPDVPLLDVGPDVAEPDVPDPDVGLDALEDVPPDAPDGEGPDAADAAADGDAGPTTWLFLIGEDEAATDPGGVSLTVGPGEGWVAEITLPLPGRLIGLQVLLGHGFDPDSCGRYGPAVWAPADAGEGLSFPDDPSWTGAPQPLEGDDAAQLVLFGTSVPVAAGPVRLGLLLDGPCTAEGSLPLLVSDGSGDTDGTWLFSPQPDAPPWVPAAFGGVEGRWAIRALLEVDAY